MSRFLPFLLMILFIVSNSSCMGAPVFVEVTVLTEAGEPVNNARITYKFLGNTRDVDYGTTNRFGRDTEIGFGGRGVEFRVEKDGYYATAGSIGRNDTKVTAVLRERVNPIAMYVKEASEVVKQM